VAQAPSNRRRDASQARRTNAEVFDALARRAFAAAQAAPRDRRFVVGLAGCPGSGKTTTAAAVVARCNALAAAQGLGEDWAALLPMDGFHLYRRQLDAMPDPAEAHRRRGTTPRAHTLRSQCLRSHASFACSGAEWTFDGAAFVAAVDAARSRAGEALSFPSFDHAAGDPVPGDVLVGPATRLVLVEGLYLFLDTPPWAQLAEKALLDERWMMDVPPVVATRRIVARHLAVGATREQAEARAGGSDALNAELVWSRRAAALPHVAVPSFDEPQR
jgi:pantothenate kinase